MNFSFRRTTYGDIAIIEQVIALADSNKKTLGFLPKSVLEEKCNNGNVFVCMNENKLVGYILFSHLKRISIIKIIHFCVKIEMRKNSVAKMIFEKFKETIHSAFYIELSCRNDYGIDNFWNKLGFNIVQAREGRAINELSILHLFRYPLQKNLLDIIDDIDERPKVLLDASIIFDFDFEFSEFNKKNSILAFSNDVLFCIAPVIFDDMRRQKNNCIKLNSIDKVKKFKILTISSNNLTALCDELEHEFPHVRISDRKQLACAIANNVKCFVTEDRQLLGLVQQFADNYGVMIYSSAEFYHNIDSVLNREIIQTELLPSTHGKLIDLRLDASALCEKFLNTARGEKRYDFITKIQKNIKNSALKSIIISNEKYGILYYSIEKRTLTVHLLRTCLKPNNFTQTATTFILRELIQIATRYGVGVIHLDDAYAPAELVSAGVQLGFFENKKLSLRYIGAMADYPDFVKTNLPQGVFPDVQDCFGDTPKMEDIYAQVATERNFFPAKFTDLDIPTYIIPIQPLWARDLITPQVIAQYGLFASDTGNVLMHDLNVYYTRTKTRISVPGRILWYLTGSASKNTHIIWAKHVIATSYLDEVHIGTKTEIFKKFWKIGVYKWEDLSGNKEDTCISMLFSRTEIFTNKIPYKIITEIIKKKMNKGFTAISVCSVSSDVFFEIYERGYENGHA